LAKSDLEDRAIQKTAARRLKHGDFHALNVRRLALAVEDRLAGGSGDAIALVKSEVDITVTRHNRQSA
jgi:hypothetical protein